MLTYGTEIQTTSDGKTVRLEGLMIGQMVFNPLSEECDEIIDVLTLTLCLNKSSEVLRPIRLDTFSLSSGQPYRPLLVSRKQEIMCCTTLEINERRRNVAVVEASSLPGCKVSDALEVTYSAIFFAWPRMILANGALCATFTNEVFQTS